MELKTIVYIPPSCIEPESLLHHTIKTYLGQHVVLKSVKQQPFITNDSTVPFHVTYLAFPVDTTKTFFADKSEIKQISPNSKNAVYKLYPENAKDPILVTIYNNRIKQEGKYVPFRINPIAASVQESNDFPVPITYFALINYEPLHDLVLPLHRSPKQSNRFMIPVPEKLYPDSWKPPEPKWTVEQTVENYKFEVSCFRILSNVDKVVLVDSFEKTHPSSTAYVLPYKLIPTDRPLNGVLLFIMKRHPDYILYFPTVTYTLDLDTLESFKRFCEYEMIEYNNYYYMMSQE